MINCAWLCSQGTKGNKQAAVKAANPNRLRIVRFRAFMSNTKNNLLFLSPDLFLFCKQLEEKYPPPPVCQIEIRKKMKKVC